DMDDRMGLQARSDALGGAFELERAGHHSPDRTNRLPLRGEAVVAPPCRDLGEQAQMDALFPAILAVLPRLLGGEAEDRREPGGKAGEQVVEHRARGAAARAVRRVAV